MSLTSHWCCVRLKILEQAQIFSAGHSITPTGGCINRKAINNKNTHILCIPNWHGYYISLLTKCFLGLSPWRGWQPSEGRWWQAFDLGIKSLLLFVQSGRMSPGALPPFSSRGFYGFCFFLMTLRAKGFAATTRGFYGFCLSTRTRLLLVNLSARRVIRKKHIVVRGI